MSVQTPTLARGQFRDWRTWLAVLKRAAFYSLPFLVFEVDVFHVQLVAWVMFLVLLPVAAYRVLRDR